MDADKKDIDKMSDDEIKKLLKIKFQETIHKVDEEIRGYKSLPERMDALKYKEVCEVFNKELTWFFAISVGTLLWILGNFDKFKVSDGSMPYKYLYMTSIILVGLSSFLLAMLQGKSFWYQHKNTKNSEIVIINIKTYMRELEGFRHYLDRALKKFDSDLYKESLQNLNISDNFTSLDNTQKELNKLFDKFEKSHKESIGIAFSENKIIAPIIIYIFGVICVSVYILIFMKNCIV